MCKYKKFTLFVIEGVFFLICLGLYVKFLFEGVIVIFVGASVCLFCLMMGNYYSVHTFFFYILSAGGGVVICGH